MIDEILEDFKRDSDKLRLRKHVHKSDARPKVHHHIRGRPKGEQQ
jgi:hypothetical protein